ncbi:hypothetical protein [Nioella sp.]|uniref:hypothetical protein n=1 Tax=Nioella sp. TaxID=1912091 RepID=UPI0035159A03
MKKKLSAALIAAMTLSAAPAFADEQAPTMSIDMVTQDTMTATEEADMLVPALFLMFFILVLGGSSGYAPT